MLHELPVIVVLVSTTITTRSCITDTVAVPQDRMIAIATRELCKRRLFCHYHCLSGFVLHETHICDMRWLMSCISTVTSLRSLLPHSVVTPYWVILYRWAHRFWHIASGSMQHVQTTKLMHLQPCGACK